MLGKNCYKSNHDWVPRERVRDDGSHSSSLRTDMYIDIDSREKLQSAKSN